MPDGSQLICERNVSTMFVMGFDGGQYGDVANGPSTNVTFASFSPVEKAQLLHFLKSL